MTFKSFALTPTQFLLNDQPFRIFSGAMHYFRIVPEYWADRLLKLRAMGLNTVETVVPWNVHEPQPGQFCFSGMADIERYIRLAGELGLCVIVRPGPYICAEWDLGGLPAWLLRDPTMRLRCMHEPFLQSVDRFWAELLPRLAPLQITYGGPVIMLQIENEYGSYGNDRQYLRALEQRMRAQGIDVPLFTSDGPDHIYLQCGTLPHIFKTANFGSQAELAMRMLRTYQPEGPLMCMEYWDGWFDHWGEVRHTRAPADAAAALDEILTHGDSVNMYMFHGGTNFGFMSGANEAPQPEYRATVTSYDYDAPLDEAGEPTGKYYAFRDVLRRHGATIDDAALPAPAPRLAPARIALDESVGLFDVLDQLATPIERATPAPMELLGQDVGLILYRTQISAPHSLSGQLSVRDAHDRAQIFLDGVLVGVLEREFSQRSLSVTIPAEGARLDLLVERMGRVNYGPNMADLKGITGDVLLEQRQLYGWQIYPLQLDERVAGLPFARTLRQDGPAFYRGSFHIDTPHDTFLALPGWTKGICWINGFNLGRYWRRGPQRTLYLPAPLLRSGQNELIVLELHGCERTSAELRDQPDLG